MVKRVPLASNQRPDVFRYGNRLILVLVFLYLLLNGLVLVNAWQHDASIGYDADAHRDYILAFSKLQLVTQTDSYEFFSPPLPYILPAWAIAFGDLTLEQAEQLAQFANVVLSLGVTYGLLKICILIHPAPALRVGTLLTLSLLPVYYKTFAFVRGEPYVVFFAVSAVYFALLIFQRGAVTLTNTVIFGVSLGALALSRQWGLLLFPAVGLLVLWQVVVHRSRWRPYLKAIVAASVLAFLISGWFYMWLRADYGQATAFNRSAEAQFSLRNQPASFYLDLGLPELFTDPIRDNFPNRFFPIFYSEMWGDYWCYFSVYGRDTRTQEYVEGITLANTLSEAATIPVWLETNRKAIAPYLGRVNLLSLFPTGMLIIAVAFSLMVVVRGRFTRGGEGVATPGQRDILLLLLLAIATSLGGYFWFLIMYPNLGKGDTIKATYALQIFPFLSILTGYILFRLKSWFPRLYFIVLAGFSGIWIHHLPAMLTHYPDF